MIGTAGPPLASGRLATIGDRLLRVIGGVLALVGGFVTAALSVLLVPLRVGHLGLLTDPPLRLAASRLPVAVVVAVAGALFLVWFARRATGLRGAALLPAVGWFTMVALALRTSDAGDRLLMPDDWVATLALFGGTIVLVIGLVMALTAPERPRVRPG